MGQSYFCNFVVDMIVYDNVSTVSAIIKDSDGSAMGHAYFFKRFPTGSSIKYENVGTVSAVIKDVDGPGMGHAYFCKRFRIGLSMEM